MQFQRPFGRRKRGNPKRGLFLILLLILVLLFWVNADRVLESFFN